MSDRRQQQHRSSCHGHSHSNSTEHDDDNERHHQHRQRPPPSQNQRRKQAAISLASFSTKKGHDRAIQEYKKRKETKFQKNATLLREYQKVMKQEGYDAGRGASRKRTDRPRKEDGSVDGDAGAGGGGGKSTREQSENKEQTAPEVTRKKRQKADPLHRARKEAERRKAEQLEAIAQKQQRQRQEGKKIKDRKVRAKKMMQRTKRGQPLIKNVIGDLLVKIKSDVGTECG